MSMLPSRFVYKYYVVSSIQQQFLPGPVGAEYNRYQPQPYSGVEGFESEESSSRRNEL